MKTHARALPILSFFFCPCAAFLPGLSAYRPHDAGTMQLGAMPQKAGGSGGDSEAFKWPFEITLPPEVNKLLSTLTGASVSKPGKDGATASAQQKKVEAEKLKAKIKRMVAPTSRGFAANATERIALRAEIDKLEALNEITEPVYAPEVLYAAPYNVTVSHEQQELSYLYGPVLTRVRELVPKDLIKAKGEFQVIDGVNGKLTNIATFTVLDKYQGRFEIDGTATPVPPARFNVTFTNGRLSVGDWKLDFSLRLLNPTGWVDITYLDEDFRLTKGDKGTLFVVARVKSDNIIDTAKANAYIKMVGKE